MLCQQRGSVSVDTLTFRRAAGRRLKGWKGGTWPARPSLALVSAACHVGSCTLLPRVISRFPPVTMCRWVVVSLGDAIQADMWPRLVV